MKEQEKIKILEKIDLYIQGKLNQDEIDELWKTFLQHPEYYDYLETEVHLQDLIRKGEKPAFDSSSDENENISKMYGYKGWLYAAAAVVLLALGIQFFSFQHPDSLSDLAVAEIEQSSLMGSDVLRSVEQSNNDLNVAINNALATAYDGETDAAIKEFQEILNQTSDTRQRASVEMNLGILYYNTGRYETAKDFFLSITEYNQVQDYMLEKAWWFLGNTYLNLDELRAAREAVFNVYNFNGRYQSTTLVLLKKLDQRLGNVAAGEEPKSLGS